MTTFVLVHGASHGSWCWDKVVPLLDAQGHQVVAVDLPGNTYGEFDIPPAQVALDTYAQHVCKVLDQLDEPVVLVGHSLGGLTITQTAEYRPDKIKSLVYLTAVLIGPGEAFIPLETRDAESIRKALDREGKSTVSDDLSTVHYVAEGLRNLFYNDCSDDDFAWADSMLVPQPLSPYIDILHTTEENYGRVRRVFIECLKDQALSPEFQKEMYTKFPCERVMTLDTGHSSFLSAPEELVAHLVSV
ncbi:MAG: alpha/beta fold hydrolase [Chloroflexi bacterium]|nr:alpha/beta fold hydrolase [Chloroflexota bacterium]